MYGKTHDDYIICGIIPVNGKCFLLGTHMQEPNQFATWEKTGNDEFLWAHYFTDSEKAEKDLCERVLQEIALKHYQGPRETSTTIGVIVKNGENTAVIDFPTRELEDILGSIGITLSPEKVEIGGQYSIEILPGDGKMANALNHLFQRGDSLYLINEVAKAVYCSDWRVCGRIGEKLRLGEYHSAEALLTEAVRWAEEIKERESNIGQSRERR